MREAIEIANERILVFGGTGSLGRALIRRLSARNTLMLFSRDEAKHWTIRNQVGQADIVFAVGDIRDGNRVEEATLRFQPTIIIIAAALKQVDTCEMTPYESIQTNVLGIKNVVDVVSRHVNRLQGLESVLMVSTDKACAPANVYGMCKAIAERLVTSQSLAFGQPRFVGVRYGNVLESRGSIIPLFRWQCEHAEFLTVTHPEMTRFVMTLEDSIDLIAATAKGAKSGEIWLPRLKSMRIADLAGIFARRYGKQVKIVGIRPGEKLHEALVSEPESARVTFDGTFYRMAPAHDVGDAANEIFTYSSDQSVLDATSLEAYMEQLGIFSRVLSDFVGLEIEEIASPSVARRGL